jgi:hypothetical protein
MWPSSDLVEEIRTRRNEGLVRCGSSKETLLQSALRAFGLVADGSGYREISAEEAREVLVSVLHHDLAYDSVMMSVDEAKSLAEFFFKGAPTDSQFFTNASFRPGDTERTKETVSIAGWTPATKATFDTGIVVISSQGAAFVWVEDED